MEIIAVILLVVFWGALRDWRVAGIAVTFVVLMFFGYGVALEAVADKVDPDYAKNRILIFVWLVVFVAVAVVLLRFVVNTKIKFREPFRPFAPAVISSAASDYFQVENVDELYPARFMLYVVPVVDDKRDVIPATTHVDGSARLQVVHDETTRYHQLISAFGQATGVPVILNTSFNLRGQPIVNSPQDAWGTFQESGLDLLVMDRFISPRP